MSCPFCDTADVQRIAPWGGQLITDQWKCVACNAYFEAIRDDALHAEGEQQEQAGNRTEDKPARG